MRIGALTRHCEMLSEPLNRRIRAAASCCCAFCRPSAIRNRGTIGGSVALADPASEFPAMTLALDAEIEIAGPGPAARRVKADDFFLELFETASSPVN